MESDSADRLAVLIDADNAQASIVEGLMTEIAKYGTASVKRIYGDWTQPGLGSWKKLLLEHSIQPIQQFGYTKGKNSTDSAMIIDAMDLLYSANFDGFCIVSSDSDFTRLASRIREAGLTVYGFGEKKTPAPFAAACDKFIYTEVLRAGSEDEPQKITRFSAAKLKQDTRLINLIRNAIDASSDDDGWAQLGPVGSNIAKQSSQFDPRNYGYAKLRELIAATKLFELEQKRAADGQPKRIQVRDLRRK